MTFAVPASASVLVGRTGVRSRFVAPMFAIAVSLALLSFIWWPFLTSETFNAGQADWRFRANYMSYTVKSFFTHCRIPFWATSPQYYQMWSLGAHGFFSNPETEVLSP
jgi:hypothetical protein